MTMLKTHRRKRRRQHRREIRHKRFLRLWGNPRLLPPLNLDEPIRWTNYTYQYTLHETAEELRERMRAAMKNHDNLQPKRGIDVPGSRRDEHCT